MIATLRRIYDLGRQSAAILDANKRKQFDVDNGLNERKASRARAFARRYTPKDLKELCRLRRPDGLPLHIGYLHFLLSVQDTQERQEIQRLAAAQGWTAPALYAEIRRRNPKRRCNHGRTMKKPATPQAGLQQLLAEGEFWRRRCQVVMDAMRTARMGQQLRQDAKGAAEAMRELAKEAGGAAGELERLRRRSG